MQMSAVQVAAMDPLVTRKSHRQPFTIYCDDFDDDNNDGGDKDVVDQENLTTIALSGPQNSVHNILGDSMKNELNVIRTTSPLENPEASDATSSSGSSSATSRNHHGHHAAAEVYGRMAANNAGLPLRKRAISNFTATSISSLPESNVETNDDEFTPTRGPRFSLRSPSTRHSRLSPHAARTHRPGSSSSSSSRKAGLRGSPRARTRGDQDVKVYLRETEQRPLVLLHVTIIPVVLPWSRAVVESIGLEDLTERLLLLKSRLTKTVLERGILVPHPQEDFEGVEEKVLEALELPMCSVNEERLDRNASAGDSDCRCNTCGDSDCFSSRLCCQEGRLWNVNVYAANGLMRLGAWEAAWTEMERVDVEIMPHVSEEVRKALDGAQAEEDRLAEEHEEAHVLPAASHMHKDTVLATEELHFPCTTSRVEQTFTTGTSSSPQPQGPSAKPAEHGRRDIPAAYRPKEIPLRILLKNYLYLVVRDRRNMAILFLITTVIFSTMHGMSMAARTASTVGISTLTADKTNNETERLHGNEGNVTWAHVVMDEVVDKSKSLEDARGQIAVLQSVQPSGVPDSLESVTAISVVAIEELPEPTRKEGSPTNTVVVNELRGEMNDGDGREANDDGQGFSKTRSDALVYPNCWIQETPRDA